MIVSTSEVTSPPIELLPIAFNVVKLQEFFESYPSWNRFDQRTKSSLSPHREADDIWARFGDLNDSNVKTDKPFECFWYEPELRDLLQPYTMRLMEAVQGIRLGGVLITRIPAGKMVYPHVDNGWHAKNYSKYCLCIKANQDQAFCYHQRELRTRSGEVFWFDNSQEHWVLNNSSEERISAIVCIETARGIHVP